MKIVCLNLFILLSVSLHGQVYDNNSLDSSTASYNFQKLIGCYHAYMETAASFGFSGAVLIAKNDTVLLRQGYGWSNEEKLIPVTHRTIFDIGSYVKAFTATAIMQLVANGKLQVSDTITKFFKDVPADKKNITIHQLLTHTSGLVYDDFYDQISQAARDSIKKRESYLYRILRFPLGYETGKGRSYSNTGFALLAAVIEIVSGISYGQYLEENLFMPAGMKETGYTIPRDYETRVAHGYNDGPTDYGFPWTTQWEGHVPLWDLMGNGGMLSTIDDLYKWTLAIKGNKILPDSMKKIMFTRYAQSDQAYGWYWTQNKNSPAYVHHPGDAVPQGWNTDFRWYPDEGFIFIILANSRIRAGSTRRPVMNKLEDITFNNATCEFPGLGKVRQKEDISKYAGKYIMKHGSTFHVYRSPVNTAGGKSYQLVIEAEGQDAVDMLAFSGQLKDVVEQNKKLNSLTDVYLHALIKRDGSRLLDFFSADTVANAIEQWTRTEKNYGPVVNYKILGSSQLNQRGSQTFFSIRFRNGHSGIYKITWRDDRIWDQAEDRLQPTLTAFIRKSNTRSPLTLSFIQQDSGFVSYDIFKDRTVKIRFRELKTKPMLLIFETNKGDVITSKAVSKDRQMNKPSIIKFSLKEKH
jgi:CubicO group peptidase (beta-lactamase class C family)